MESFDGTMTSGRKGIAYDWQSLLVSGTMTSGRKGIAYDWQSLLVSAESAALELELATLAPEYAE